MDLFTYNSSDQSGTHIKGLTSIFEITKQFYFLTLLISEKDRNLKSESILFNTKHQKIELSIPADY